MPNADTRTYFFDNLRGLGLSSQQALGVLYSLGGESHANLDPTAVGAGGDFGVAQWTGTRKAGLDRMASSMGLAPTDARAQWAWMRHELTDGDYKSVLSQLKQAPNAAEATRIWTTNYEGPLVNNWQQRYAGGANVGKIDADGNLVLGPGGAKPNLVPGGAPGAGSMLAASVPPGPNLSSPMGWGQMLGTALGGGGDVGGAIRSAPVEDVPDQPAIRSPALSANLTAGSPSPNPPPSLGSQLGELASQPEGAPGLQNSPVGLELPSGVSPMAALTGGVSPASLGAPAPYPSIYGASAAPRYSRLA